MEWAKTHAHGRYNLASSGVAAFPFKQLAQISNLRLEDLDLTGPAGYGYGPLQNALAKKAGVAPECVVAATGTSLANHLAMAASVEPGDDVLIEWPAYELLVTTARYLGANVRRFPRQWQDGFRLEPREVEKALTPETKLIVVTNLHNPSSAFADDAALRAVGELAKRIGARVLVDEVYLESCFSTGWRTAFHLGDHFIATSSLTKAYGLLGLRCGWAIAEPELARAMWRLNDFYGVNAAHPAEHLCVVALEHLGEIAAGYQTLLESNRRIVNQFLDAHPELELARQPYGTVLFPRLRNGSAGDFCRLLEEQYETSVVPGSFFEAPEHFRLFVAAEKTILVSGLERLSAALDRWKHA